MVFEKYQSERSSLINENSVDRDVQVIERKLDINNIDFKTLVEIPINERYKYENKEIISLQGGMAPGSLCLSSISSPSNLYSGIQW